eukprot:CAMPEP_0181340554 /NCGR_PEP_ID=MMETSP1101-20121128/29908_1 /TAXON_ID=46948 /ORGANISM="Rhodomonas abbreviata, Strain Caron Lab Isolate" /LENGTH=105 /DNA_ID=CAMNT_0023451711 /DNA_START=184 /DNA_END=502 /DNA_ORIENTATION=+
MTTEGLAPNRRPNVGPGSSAQIGVRTARSAVASPGLLTLGLRALRAACPRRLGSGDERREEERDKVGYAPRAGLRIAHAKAGLLFKHCTLGVDKRHRDGRDPWRP